MNVQEIVTALGATPMHDCDDLATGSPSQPPQSSGYYAWWQKPGALPGVPGTPHAEQPLELLYVGIAPGTAQSKSDLRKRLGKHHRGAIGSSTFRFALTAFLWQREDWQPHWTDRVVLPTEQLAALAAWQRENLLVQWVEAPAPWDHEALVVRTMLPPLNRDHNEHHPFYEDVGRARDRLRQAARAQGG